MFEALNKLVTVKKQFEEQMAREGRKALTDATKDLFDKHPEAVAIRWEQYTPYFNDGDSCVFSVNQPYLRLASGKEDDGDCEDGFVQPYEFRDRPDLEGLAEDFRAFSGMLQDLEEALRTSFGDHSQITVTRDEITVEEYEHD